VGVNPMGERPAPLWLREPHPKAFQPGRLDLGTTLNEERPEWPRLLARSAKVMHQPPADKYSKLFPQAGAPSGWDTRTGLNVSSLHLPSRLEDSCLSPRSTAWVEAITQFSVAGRELDHDPGISSLPKS
jgi:hypothetical protein